MPRAYNDPTMFSGHELRAAAMILRGGPVTALRMRTKVQAPKNIHLALVRAVERGYMYESGPPRPKTTEKVGGQAYDLTRAGLLQGHIELTRLQVAELDITAGLADEISFTRNELIMSALFMRRTLTTVKQLMAETNCGNDSVYAMTRRAKANGLLKEAFNSADGTRTPNTTAFYELTPLGMARVQAELAPVQVPDLSMLVEQRLYE